MSTLEIEAGDDHQRSSGDEEAPAAAAIHVHAIEDHPLKIHPESMALRTENERLKEEIRNLKRRMQELQQTDTSSIHPLPVVSEDPAKWNADRKPKKPTVFVELPPTLRTMVSQTSNHTNTASKSNRSEKDHRSVSTTDEREAVEHIVDIEAHQSARGLHHRSPMAHGNKSAATYPTHKTEFLTDDSDTSSDDDDEEEELTESRVLIPSPARRGPDGILIENCRTTSTSSSNSTANPHRSMTFWQSLTDRAGWLIGLLIFQSLSSFILARNELLLKQHAVIVQFLTMLVGAGGNAGNQASVGVVRGIAVGSVHRANARSVLSREFAMGVALSLILGFAGFVRAKVFAVPWIETIAITMSLFMIVIISVIVGATLPMAMQAVGIDPAHSSTTIQVVMDITGVVITVQVCSLLLDPAAQDWLDAALSLDGETR